MKPLKPMEDTINNIRCQFVDHGGYYRLQFTDPRSGIRERKSTRTANPTAAKAFANQLLAGYVPGVSTIKTVTVGELVTAMLNAKRNHSERDYTEKKRNWELRLRDHFEGWDYRDLTTDVLEDHKSWCLGLPVDDTTSALRRSWTPIDQTVATVTDTDKDGNERTREIKLDVISKATINLDLAVISKAFNDAHRSRKISLKPAIPKFGKEELGVRIGEVNLEEFERIMAQPMPLGIRGYLQVSWDCGPRAGEPKHLRVHQFDGLGFQLAPGHDRTHAATEKNGQGRWVPLSEAGIALVRQLVAGKAPSDYVFTRDYRGKGERKLGQFRKTWKNLLRAAGVRETIIPHDFRRTAVTNLRESGADEKTCMEIVGHKTPEMNRRYRQTGKRRLIEAMRKKEAWEREQAGTPPQGDTVALLQRQLEEGKAREAQMQAALTALQTAIANLNMAPTTIAAPAGQQRQAEVN